MGFGTPKQSVELTAAPLALTIELTDRIGR